mgnify:CR=1 FL=1
MAKYNDAKCRLCRREGTKLLLKGDRCFTDKCAFDRRPYAPGQHGRARKKLSDYAVQLREKQKVRRVYGVLEKQFHAYYESAAAASGKTGDNLLILVERRLDNVVYRMGLAATRRQARQLVSHAHFTVNGKKVNIPSYLVKAGDVIEVAESSRSSELFKRLTGENAPMTLLPAWLERTKGTLQGTVAHLPTREEIDTPVEEHLIVELYSK